MYVMASIQPRWRPGLSSRRWVKTALLTFSLAAASPAASAQFGGYGGMTSGLSSRDLRQIEDILMLDDEQREVVHLLFGDFLQETQEISRKQRVDQRAEREAHFNAISAGVFYRDGRQGQIIVQAVEMRLDLEGWFIDDVRALLSEEQAARWPKLERAIRRNQSVPLGFLSGVRVDLTRLVSQIELKEASLTLVSPLIEQYEVDFDRALRARYEFQMRIYDNAIEIMQSGKGDEIEDPYRKMIKLEFRIRDVNRRFAREIEGHLAGGEQARFNDAFNRASFPEVFKPSRAQRALDLVLAFEDLSGEQRSTVEKIGTRFRRDTSILNKQHMAAINELEMSMKQDDWVRYQAGTDLRGQGDHEETPRDKVVQMKRELETKTIKSIERALEEGQIAELENQLAKIPEQERK